MEAAEWDEANARCIDMMIDGRVRFMGLHRRCADEILLMIFNAWHDLINFSLPGTVGAEGWERLIDTNAPDAGEERFGIGSAYEVMGKSLLLFRLIQSDDAAQKR